MAEDSKSEEDDRDGIRADRILHSAALISKIGLSVSMDMAETLYSDLERMARNRSLWLTDPYSPALQRHLMFTLLVPGGRATRAAEAISLITNGPDGFLVRDDPKSSDRLRERIRFLWPIWCPFVRFPAQKEARLLDTFKLSHYEIMVREVLKHLDDPKTLHRWLQKSVLGFGPKAAAHFMRNTGLQTMDTEFLPIVDTHVRKFNAAYAKLSGKSTLSFTVGRHGKEFELACLADGANPLLTDAFVWTAYSKTGNPERIDFGEFNDGK